MRTGVSSSPASTARKVTKLVAHGTAEAILFLDVPFAEKDRGKRVGANWDGAMRKWDIAHGLAVRLFSRWWPEALRL